MSVLVCTQFANSVLSMFAIDCIHADNINLTLPFLSAISALWATPKLISFEGKMRQVKLLSV